MRRVVLTLLLLMFTACPPPVNSPESGKTNIDPEACGSLDATDLGRRIHAFLVASAELDRTSYQLERAVQNSCRRMAVELRVSPLGDAATLCRRVATALEDSLEVSVSQEQQFVTRTKPSVCSTEVDFAADVAATCEARAVTDIRAWCEGRCAGQCRGACDGACAGGNAGGQCNGTCDGTCNGTCTGRCEGAARVDASAECRASAEIRADVRTVCTEPSVVVETQNMTVIDASKLDRATAAIDAGMPGVLSVGAKAAVVAKGLGHWAATAAKLARSAASFFDDLGDQSVCAIGQIGTAMAASAQINARVSISIEASASISTSAGAQSY